LALRVLRVSQGRRGLLDLPDLLDPRVLLGLPDRPEQLGRPERRVQSDQQGLPDR
jgi:hypothetical protein